MPRSLTTLHEFGWNSAKHVSTALFFITNILVVFRTVAILRETVVSIVIDMTVLFSDLLNVTMTSG